MHMATPQPAATHTPSGVFFSTADIPHRVRDIALMRGLGYSFREIAEQFNVTQQAVALMLSRHRRSMKSLRGAFELSQLSSRAVNALGRHGISSRSEATNKDVLSLLRNERNCGRKTLDEIRRWMNDPAD